MVAGLDPSFDEAIREIAALLAVAYRRHAQLRQVGPPNQPLPSTEGLDNTGEPSPHELTLTRRRKESRKS
jgi:hypothetical protein